MAELSPLRRLLKVVHPEAIPWPGTVFYNAISETSVFQRHYELIAKDIINCCSEGTILDVGTGPGWLLVKLYQISPRLRMVGLDASPAMVDRARKNMAIAGLSDVVEIKEGEARHMPFTDSSFDIVVSTGSVHHWKEPTACLNDIYRILKQGGYALLYDFVSDTPKLVIEESRREFGRFKILFLWLHTFEEPFYTRKDFEWLAHSSLFEEGRTKFVGLFYCLIMRKGTAKD